MAIQTDTSEINYSGNGSTTTAYVIPFVFFDEEDVVVIVTEQGGQATKLVLHWDYLVTGAGDEDGGALTTTQAIPSTSTVTIYREVEATQQVVYDEGSEFPAKSHERALDKLTMLVQQFARSILRSVQVPVSDHELRPVQAVPSTLLGFDGTKQPRTYNLDQLTSFLTLTTRILQGEYPMKTFADEDCRALAVPGFEGQLGTQVSDQTIWIAGSTTAGDWVKFEPDGSVTLADIAPVDAGYILGRKTAGTGSAEQVAVGTGLALTMVSDVPTLSATPAATAPSLSGCRSLRLWKDSPSAVKFQVAEIVLSSGSDQKKFVATAEIPVTITTSEAGGLDTGTEAASTWYDVWAISNGTVLNGLLCQSSMSPQPPGTVFTMWEDGVAYAVGAYVREEGGDGSTYRCVTAHTSGAIFADDITAGKWALFAPYKYKQFLGSVRNDSSSNFVDFVQFNDDVWTSFQGTSLTGHDSTFVSYSIAGFVPPAAIYATGNFGTTSANALITIAADSTGSLGRSMIDQNNTNTWESYVAVSPFAVPLKQAQTIYYKTYGGSSNTHYRLEITGWRYLGK